MGSEQVGRAIASQGVAYMRSLAIKTCYGTHKNSQRYVKWLLLKYQKQQ